MPGVYILQNTMARGGGKKNGAGEKNENEAKNDGKRGKKMEYKGKMMEKEG